MNFKSSAAALVAATVLTAPAGASVKTPVFTEEQVTQLVNMTQLSKHIRNVATLNVTTCKGIAFFIHGRVPEIKICANEIDDLGGLQRALNHEAIHLAQWCHGNDSIYSTKTINAYAKDKGYEHDTAYAHAMASQYPKDEYDGEFEAYFMTRDPEYSVVSYLKDHCS